MLKKDLDLEGILNYIKKVLGDKKKKQYLLLFLIIIAIIILAKNKFFTNEITNANADITNNIDEIEQNEIVDSSSKIYVDISGEVNNPGVYEVTSNTRLYEVIELAGGLTENANVDSLNRAETVFDGQKVIVQSYLNETNNDLNSIGNGIVNGKVSLNNGSLEDLMTLPGIGSTKAQRIIEYRISNGKFKDISEVKNVSGIGDATYESIKDLICL